MRNNIIHQLNVVTRRAATELTGVVTRYGGVRPKNNNDNNNHVTLVERFQASTLHKLRQLGLYTNIDTPDTRGFNDWGGRGYDDFFPGEVTKTAPSGDETT